LQLLRELVPDAAAFGVLADPALPATPSIIMDLQAAARTLGLQLVFVNASIDNDLETAFATFSQHRVGAVLVSPSTFYGSSLGYLFHQVGIYTGRILKGEKPADLPVEQITKIDLVINLKTAKALGLTIPETLLATADEVIQ
jgi:putative ABC transport system substrate-binding protein